MNLFSKTLSALALGTILVGGAATAADRDWIITLGTTSKGLQLNVGSAAGVKVVMK